MVSSFMLAEHGTIYKREAKLQSSTLLALNFNSNVGSDNRSNGHKTETERPSLDVNWFSFVE